MHASKIKVLLIRESQNTYSPLTDHLRRGGCECCFAASKREAGLLLDNHTFDLVLGPIRLKSESLYPLIGRLDGSLTTLFYSQPVEHGCWWLPALRRGQNCFGAPAFRPGEFVTVLDAIIAEIRSSMRVAAEAQPHIASQHSGSVVKPPYSRRVPRATLSINAKSLSLSTETRSVYVDCQVPISSLSDCGPGRISLRSRHFHWR